MKARIILPLIAIGLGAFYIDGLRPASGAAGGMIFMLTGWAIPSLLVLVLSLWAALFVEGRLRRLAVFLLVSIVLGPNTKWPDVVAQVLAKREVEWQVDRPTAFGADAYVNFYSQSRDGGMALSKPLFPTVSWSGSERCMCLYFKRNTDGSYDHDAQTFMPGLNFVSYSTPPENYPHMSYVVEPEEGGRAATVTLQIHDEQGVAARFKQRAIPYVAAPRGMGPDNLGSDAFLSNALDSLLHENLWLTVIRSQLPGYFAQQAFQDFRAQAFRPAP